MRERERVFFIKLNGTIEFHFFLNWKHHINDFYHGRNHTKLDHKEIKFDIEIIFIKLSFEKGIFCKIVWKGHIATYLSKYEYLPILAAIYIYIYTHTHTHKFYLIFFFFHFLIYTSLYCFIFFYWAFYNLFILIRHFVFCTTLTHIEQKKKKKIR